MAIIKWPRLQQYDAEMKQYIATHYEPKLHFNPTPIYDVTFAEDTIATSSNKYYITQNGFGEKYQNIDIYCISPFDPNLDNSKIGLVQINLNDGKELAAPQFFVNYKGSVDNYSHFSVWENKGLLLFSRKINTPQLSTTTVGMFGSSIKGFVPATNRWIKTLSLYGIQGNDTIPAGFRIIIYAATEV